MNIQLLLRVIGFGLNILSWIAPKRAATLALHLFTNPPKPRIRSKEQDFLNKSKKIEMRDTIQYCWGDDDSKPYILLAYGWGYNAGRWRHFVPSLVEAGYRVIAFDPPGHGHAPKGQLTLPANAEIVQNIIREYGKPAAIIGHSFGGSAAILAMHRLPPSLHANRIVAMASFADAEGVFRDFQHRLGMREGLYQDYVRLTESKVQAKIVDFDLAILSGKMAHIRGLVIHDPADTTTDFKHAIRYQTYWPGSLLLAAHKAGHHLGLPEITEAVCAFAANGDIPKGAEKASKNLPSDHDLTRFFAGM